MTGPLDAVLVLAHVLVALIGFGALAATGTFASRARHSRDPFSSEALARYFRPGHNLAARAIFLVPVLGAALLALNGRSDVDAWFPWIGLAIWMVATGLASGVAWPAERVVQEVLAGRDTSRRLELDSACRRCERAATLTSVCFVAALVVMIAQP